MMKDIISLKLAFYGGAGIGLLFGVLMGTSVTPTVGTMIGALTTLLAAILGLNDPHFNNAKSVRIGSFGFACVVGAYLGLFVRSHNLLSPSLSALKAQYLELGFSEQQALNFIAQTELGINQYQARPAEQQVSTASSENKTDSNLPVLPLITAAPTEHNAFIGKQHSSVLFSAPVELSGCDELSVTDSSLPLDEVINNFELTGGVWEQLALDVLSDFSTEKQKRLLLTTKDAVCKVEQVQESSCLALLAEFAQADHQQALDAAKAHNLTWNKVASAIDLSDLSASEKLLSLRLARATLCR